MANSKFRCTGCKDYFPIDERKLIGSGRYCTFDCAVNHGKAKAKAKAEKVSKEKHKALKKKVRDEDRGYWTKKAQAEFNKFIRLRDRNNPCISCGRYHTGQIHAGHFRSVGAMPALRYTESNCHAQCAPCNNHLSGNIVAYRKRLLEKVGLEKLEWLERDHPSRRYSISNLKTIHKWYKRKNRRLERAKD